MTTMFRRDQITPTIALIALVAAALALQLIGMHLGEALAAGGLLGAGLAAAVWGMSTPGTPAPQRVRWLLWPHAAAVVVLAWLSVLHLVPRISSGMPHVDAAVDTLLLSTAAFFTELWLRGRRLGRLPLSIAMPASLAGLEAALQRLSPHHVVELGGLLGALAGVGVGFLLAEVLCDRHLGAGRYRLG